MKIDWNPSVAFIAKAKKIYELHEKGISYRQIAKEVGHTYSYVCQLAKFFRTQIKE